MSFEQMGLAAQMLRAVAGQGYTIPTPVQSQAIPHVLSGRDLLACAQTGTGKTAAFALPILQRLSQAGPPPRVGRCIRALVLAPTRELAVQITQSFQAYGRFTALRVAAVFGGVAQGPQVRALEQGLDILVATPGRLLDLMNQGWVDLSAVQTLVLDESDRMLDMGFLPDVRRVIAQLPERRQTVMFSATLPEPIEKLAAAITREPMRIRIAPPKTEVPLIEQSVYFVAKSLKSRLLTAFLSAPDITRALIFTRTKRGADRVAEHLNRAGIPAAAMHGNKTQATRQRTLADFKSSRTTILVATDIAARGIDVTGISHVLNYDLPEEPETYVHRIGRTGRAGATGIAVSFCDAAERPYLQAIQKLIRQTVPLGTEPELVSLAAQPVPASRAGSAMATVARPRYAARKRSPAQVTVHAGHRPQRTKRSSRRPKAAYRRAP